MELRKEKVLLEAVLTYLVRDAKVSLSLKPKREEGERKIGEGSRNGLGGGRELGESLIDAAIREVFEESGVRLCTHHLTKKAIANFHNTKSDGSVFTCRVHVYLATGWFGEPQSVPGHMIDPQWYSFKELPVDEMMPADRFWVPPLLLHPGLLVVDAHYEQGQQRLKRGTIIDIKQVDTLPI
ncbi:MAG: hypothetical protein A3C88_00015 [Candidatus Yanofskybacteria bacterium RIFCSPHIGHO2_02_FULL_50_12]|uniref:Nudix hydrolase domain-containing protein n=1 Tax=Candidatus Yanofskybacteria bacterium RIFCSPHIGHO2_02_FULL_50_12 TaxID=1802685 RepID=A0A1F8FWM3_9BACT|nr:MAG: hypothetical protein A3C88_00015 [Candidatus Yanofskybacteria bacterium RIFCSPHIGHO2_02_FULL_50_12]